jgi:hypothetical protein
MCLRKAHGWSIVYLQCTCQNVLSWSLKNQIYSIWFSFICLPGSICFCTLSRDRKVHYMFLNLMFSQGPCSIFQVQAPSGSSIGENIIWFRQKIVLHFLVSELFAFVAFISFETQTNWVKEKGRCVTLDTAGRPTLPTSTHPAWCSVHRSEAVSTCHDVFGHAAVGPLRVAVWAWWQPSSHWIASL